MTSLSRLNLYSYSQDAPETNCYQLCLQSHILIVFNEQEWSLLQVLSHIKGSSDDTETLNLLLFEHERTMRWSDKWGWNEDGQMDDVPSVSEGSSSSLQLLAPAAPATGREDSVQMIWGLQTHLYLLKTSRGGKHTTLVTVSAGLFCSLLLSLLLEWSITEQTTRSGTK